MRGWILVTALMISGCGDSGGDGDVSARTEQCEQVRGHIVELRLAMAHGLSADELAQHRDALMHAMGAQFIDECIRTTTTETATCVLAAHDTQAINDCNTATSGN